MATIESMFEDSFNCTKCQNTYSKRPDYAKNKAVYDKNLEVMQLKKGCLKPGPVKYKLENIKYSICVGNFYSQSASQYVDLYYNYQRGVMPFEGSLMDQPSKIIEVFNIIDGLVKSKEKALSEKQQAEYERKNKIKGSNNGKRSKI